MCLARTQARIHIIQISCKDRARHCAHQAITQPIDEIDAGGRERAIGIACKAIMLDHPQRSAVRVRRGGDGRYVDLATGAAVEIDDAKPGVRRIDARTDDVVEVAIKTFGCEWGGGWHDDGLSEEVVMQSVFGAIEGLGEGATEEREGLDPVDGLDGGGGGGGEGA